MKLKPLIAPATLAVAAAMIITATSASAATTRYEAETSPATCDGTIDSNHAGFSGSGFCNANNAVGAASQFTVTNGPKKEPKAFWHMRQWQMVGRPSSPSMV